MKKIIFTLLAVATVNIALMAQVTVSVTVTNVSVDFTNEPCDLDGFGSGDTDPEWDADVTDNRGNSEDFRHEESETNFDVNLSSGFDNPLTFSQTYNGICPPNFLSVEWSAYDDDVAGTDANTGTNNVTLPVVSGGAILSGTNAYTFTGTAGDCGGTTWSITFSVTISGATACICADEPCDADMQIIQDGCDNNIVIKRYEVSNSTSTFPAGSTTCGEDGNNDIFFSFVAPASGEIVMDMTAYDDGTLFGLTDLTINLYEGPCTALTIVDTETYSDNNGGSGIGADCVDLSGGLFNDNYTPIYFENLTPGQTYYIRMSEEEDDTAYADLAFEAIVENNDCPNGEMLMGNSAFQGCNYNATDEGEPDIAAWTGDAHTGTFAGGAVQTCSGWLSNENGVWYNFKVDDTTPQPITLDVQNVVCEGGASTLQMGIWYAGNGPTCSCDLSSLQGVGCDVGVGTVSVTLPDNVPNGKYYVFMDGNAGAQCVWEFVSDEILPVELIAFDAKLLEEQVELTWTTETEIDNAGFEILRSADGKNWKAIGYVEGQGTTNERASYTWMDIAPQAGSNYYRLKQFDFDGKFIYTEVVEIYLGEGKTKVEVTAAPNPTTDFIQYELNTDTEVLEVQFYDQVGRLVLIAPTASQQISLAQLQSGIYTMVVVTAQETISTRIVKQ